MKRWLVGIIAIFTCIANVSAKDGTHNVNDSFQATVEARDLYWAAIGTVEPDVLAPLISPNFTGGPAWPTTRQAYRVIRRDASIILATDGMSDPFEGVKAAGNGFEMELFLETADIPAELTNRQGDIGLIRDSSAFALLKQMADTVAGAGGIVPMLGQHGVLSLEIPGASDSEIVSAQVPRRFITSDDSIGILIGAPDPDFPTRIDGTPLSPVHTVPVVLITAAELEFVRQGGASARKELAAGLAASPSRHRSDLRRADVAAEDK